LQGFNHQENHPDSEGYQDGSLAAMLLPALFVLASLAQVRVQKQASLQMRII
jgi:hypothetical protein